jgi:hypothetical protein
MKISVVAKVVWFLIIGLYFLGSFMQIHWIDLVVGPILVGLFAIITNRQMVDYINELYAKRDAVSVSPLVYWARLH